MCTYVYCWLTYTPYICIYLCIRYTHINKYHLLSPADGYQPQSWGRPRIVWSGNLDGTITARCVCSCSCLNPKPYSENLDGTITARCSCFFWKLFWANIHPHAHTHTCTLIHTRVYLAYTRTHARTHTHTHVSPYVYVQGRLLLSSSFLAVALMAFFDNYQARILIS